MKYLMRIVRTRLIFKALKKQIYLIIIYQKQISFIDILFDSSYKKILEIMI